MSAATVKRAVVNQILMKNRQRQKKTNWNCVQITGPLYGPVFCFLLIKNYQVDIPKNSANPHGGGRNCGKTLRKPGKSTQSFGKIPGKPGKTAGNCGKAVPNPGGGRKTSQGSINLVQGELSNPQEISRTVQLKEKAVRSGFNNSNLLIVHFEDNYSQDSAFHKSV